MSNWFSTYKADDWQLERDGINELFATQVTLIRDWFNLRKEKNGLHISTGLWKEYFLNKRTVFVHIESFSWLEFRKVDPLRNGYYFQSTRYKTFTQPYLTPVFKLKLQIAADRKTPDGNTERVVFFNNTLEIEFPPSFPRLPPRMRIDDSRYNITDSVSGFHHIWQGGWFCVFGHGEEWNSEKDTIISAVNVGLTWIVWHYDKYDKHKK